MAISFLCYLDDLLLDSPPINITSIQLSIIRDVSLHGIGAEATTDPLEFIGNGAEYLETIKDSQGLKAAVIFKAMQSCGPEEEFETMIEGQLDFSSYKKKCGTICSVTIPMETVSCEAILKSRYDQAVDMDSSTAFDGMTALEAYEDMGFPIQLPTRELDYESEGYVIVNDEPLVIGPVTGATHIGLTRPDYSNVISSNYNQTELTGGEIIGFMNSSIISPVLLWDERLVNFPQPTQITGRLKGNLTLNNPGFPTGNVGEAFLCVFRGELTPDLALVDISGVPNPLLSNIAIQTIYPFSDATSRSIDFDFSFSYVWNPTDSGTDGIYVGLLFNVFNNVILTVTWDPETHFKAETVKAVPPSWTQGYMVHEALSRVVEFVTNKCAKVKSSYYGRKDSRPYAFDSDGCGSLRMVTSGLKIRNAPPPDTFAISPQDFIQGLQAIDNIGMDVAANLDGGAENSYVVRIEDLDFFYKNIEIISCPAIPNSESDISPALAYSKIQIGYKKWQTQANFGLDEYNSDRQYATSITSIQSAVDLRSVLVAGEYAIEITREQQAVESSSADTTYDNDTFIICLKRISPYGVGYAYAYGGVAVEQGGVLFPSNIFSPDSTYNYRISPARNMLRWFRSIMASYPNINDADNKIYFSTGTGNILASGELADEYLNDCVLEGLPLGENDDIRATQFKDPTKAIPLWRPETITFDYPLSLSDYKKIKANPYGYVSFQCGANGSFDQGWISELKYTPVQGMANFTLRRRWLQQS